MVDTRWDETFAALAAFITSQGRLPARHTGDAHEEHLIRWLYYQRQHHWSGRLASDRAGRLDQLWDWRQPPRAEQRSRCWTQQLTDLAAFVARHDRYPTRAKRANEQEQTLAVFLHRQRRSARERTLSIERANQLEQTLPGWNRKPQPWRQRQNEQHRTAARQRLQPHREAILAGLASGRTPNQIATITGVPHQLIFGVARYDPDWSRQLETALIRGRNENLDHGTLSAYAHGCRCDPCRQRHRNHRKPRRSRAKI